MGGILLNGQVSGTFSITPTLLKTKKELHPKLPVGKGKGPLVRKIDPRAVEIFLDGKEVVKVNEEIFALAALETLVKEQAYQFGTDIPVALYCDKDVTYSQVKKVLEVLKGAELYRYHIKYFRSAEWDGFTRFPFYYLREGDGYPKEQMFIEIDFLASGELKVKNGPISTDIDGKQTELTRNMRQEQFKKEMLKILEADPEIILVLTIDDDLTIDQMINVFDFFNEHRASNVVLR